MRNRAHFGRVSDSDVRLIRIFRTVVACGGLSAAESELNIGRSTISRHLSDLETRLGVRLCVRGHGGFAMTEEGERIYDASTELLSAIETFESQVVDTHRNISGHLVIAIFDNTSTNPSTRFSDAVAEFDETAPNVSLEIHIAPTYVIENGVQSGRFHIGITPTKRQAGGLEYHHLFDERMFLYAGRTNDLFDVDDPEEAQDMLSSAKYAGIGFASPNMDVGNAMNFKRAADVYHQEALALLILSGRYVGFLPDHYAQQFVDQGLMKPIWPDQYNYVSPFWSVMQSYTQRPRLIQAFFDCLERAHADS